MKSALRWLLAVMMVGAGIMHFHATDMFASIIPHFLPWHRALVLISGAFEIIFGFGLLLPKSRRDAAIGLILLYVAVFPANINMAVSDTAIDGHHYPLLLWLRLPLQFLLIAWAWWFTKPEPADRVAPAVNPL